MRRGLRVTPGTSVTAVTSVAAVTMLLCLSPAALGDELPMPRVHASGGIPYVSGGIGAEERQAMQAQSREYNLRLSFSHARSGALLADIKVIIHDSEGNRRLEINSEGPLLFLRLPAGRYRLEAMHAGILLAKNVVMNPESSRALALQWPE